MPIGGYLALMKDTITFVKFCLKEKLTVTFRDLGTKIMGHTVQRALPSLRGVVGRQSPSLALRANRHSSVKKGSIDSISTNNDGM
jgi:hypothetical protein